MIPVLKSRGLCRRLALAIGNPGYLLFGSPVAVISALASPRFLQSGGRPAFSSLELGDHGHRHMAEVTERELTARAMSHRVLVDGHPANEPQLCCSHGTAAMGPALARTRSNVTVIKGAVLSVPES
ncbi:hypothetical protein CSOJ01_02226 [Colletotrichum sojae]|uniref:Uncharacterized protein n=1 Tax=Colletotrichum sojae TaxID=2175907 RepID=A0A8H6N2D5_9PEZI|nr:hypothetical protein CSOJ01_02226 [Colletotrichum sojae]